MRVGRAFWLALIICVSLSLAACTPAALPRQEKATVTTTAHVSPSLRGPTSAPTRTPTSATPLPATATAVPVPTETAPFAVAFAVCSPLEDIAISELGQPDLLKTPFQPPRPGMDDGHHGVDFAYWSRGEHKQMLGLPVHSVLSGRVAGVILNRQPYGNAVIIETPLSAFPRSVLQMIPIPKPSPTVQPSASLNCPADPVNYITGPDRSLYLLYAHFNQAPLVQMGQEVACGQAIGEVGTTGKSVNPHLHLETRAGPSGATFPAMAHYDTSATEAEMRTYCTWRVSGLFQMFDPMNLFH